MTRAEHGQIAGVVMKILVFVKHVPDTETRIKLSGGGASAATLDDKDFKYMVNPYDEFAIEEAILTKDKVGAGEIVAITMGPTRSQEAIRKALAMGADSGIWINTDGIDESRVDSTVTALVLAHVAREQQPQIIFVGQKAIDDDCGHIGPMLAEALGMPHVQVVTKIEMTGGNTTARVAREVEGGMIEVYDVSLPAVLGTHKSLNLPRFPSLPGIMKAKKKPLQELRFDDVVAAGAIQSTPAARTISYELPPEKAAGKIFKGKPVSDMIKEVVGLLRTEAKVI
jgi:electron transfer flavoprotein beta subunit